MPRVVVVSVKTKTQLTITSDINPPTKFDFHCLYGWSIILLCKTPTSAMVTTLSTHSTLLPCPVGFYFNTTTHECQCYFLNPSNRDTFVCSNIGKACIRRGYWFGNVSSTIAIDKCTHSFCIQYWYIKNNIETDSVWLYTAFVWHYNINFSVVFSYDHKFW